MKTPQEEAERERDEAQRVIREHVAKLHLPSGILRNKTIP